MKIVVGVKHVPDTETKIKVGPGGIEPQPPLSAMSRYCLRTVFKAR